MKAMQNVQLVGMEACRKMLFPDEGSWPSRRTFRRWRAAGYFPVHKIGRRVFLDRAEVGEALLQRFRVEEAAKSTTQTKKEVQP